MRFDSNSNTSHSKDAGYVAASVAASLVVFCGFLGLALDVGNIYFQKQHMQAAADSGALAAAREMDRGNTDLVTSAATDDTTSNGYTNGVNGVTVNVNNPPSSGRYAANAKYVEVIVSQSQPLFFMKALGLSSLAVSVRSVSGPGGSTGGCLYALS